MLAVVMLACAAWASGAARPQGGDGGRSRMAAAYAGIATRKPASPRASASIVGGSGASIASFPFQVALYDPRAGSPAAGFFCGGVIVDATHVATAAHCVAGVGQADLQGKLAVLAGSSTLDPAEPGSVRDPVRSSVFDSHYNTQTSDYDVALLTLTRPLWSGQTAPSVNGTNAIAPLQIDRAKAARFADPDTSSPVLVTASGWGDVHAAPGHGATYPASLRAVRLPLVPTAVCEEEYSGIEQQITSSMICAGGGRSHLDTCYGDSGGPLVADQGKSPRPPGDYVLVGLVDFGNGCAQAGYAGVYTRVANTEVARFLTSGSGHAARAVGTQARHKKKRKKRHRDRPARGR